MSKNQNFLSTVSQPLNNGDDVQQMLEQVAIIQMQEDCKVLNCKFLSQSVSEKIQLCEPCWVAYMFACNSFEKQYSMLQKYVPLEEAKYIVKKPRVNRHRRQVKFSQNHS